MNKQKPYVICNMMISLDGKISFGTINGEQVDYPIFWDYMDMYEEVEKTYSKDWSYILGRKTMAESSVDFNSSLKEFDKIDIDVRADFTSSEKFKNYGVYTDIKGSLRWDTNNKIIHGEKMGLVAIVVSSTPKNYLSYLRSKDISYIIGGETEINFQFVFEKLKQKLNIEKLLLEGGGSINGSVIEEDLIDEISLMILPFVVNNVEAPELFYSNPKVPKVHSFKLEEVIKMDRGVVRLRYLR